MRSFVNLHTKARDYYCFGVTESEKEGIARVQEWKHKNVCGEKRGSKRQVVYKLGNETVWAQYERG